jgi:MFS family permease
LVRLGRNPSVFAEALFLASLPEKPRPCGVPADLADDLYVGRRAIQPSINAIISNAAPADAQGLVQGANQSQQALARMLGPLLAAVFSPFDLGAPYWAAGAIAAAGAALLTLRRSAAS